jgi:hypothetical protein
VTELEVVGRDEFDVPCMGLDYETWSEEEEAAAAEKKDEKENSNHLDVNAFSINREVRECNVSFLYARLYSTKHET